MKPYTLILSLLIAQAVYSQAGADTTISRRKLDSLETELYRLKDRARRLEYENKVCTNLYAVDSVVYGKDSVIISYRGKSGQLIKRHKKFYNIDDGSVGAEKVEYCNSTALPEFVELWEHARSSDVESGHYFTWTIYSYERFEYDTAGRVDTWIDFYPSISKSKARKFKFKYTANGERTFSREYIDLRRFWD